MKVMCRMSLLATAIMWAMGYMLKEALYNKNPCVRCCTHEDGCSERIECVVRVRLCVRACSWACLCLSGYYLSLCVCVCFECVDQGHALVCAPGEGIQSVYTEKRVCTHCLTRVWGAGAGGVPCGGIPRAG